MKISLALVCILIVAFFAPTKTNRNVYQEDEKMASVLQNGFSVINAYLVTSSERHNKMLLDVIDVNNYPSDQSYNTHKCLRLTTTIDEQLDLIEQTIFTTAGIDEQLDFLERNILGSHASSVNFSDVLETNRNVSQDHVKMALALQKGFSMITAHLLTSSKEHNQVLRTVIDLNYPSDKKRYVTHEEAEAIKKDYIQYFVKRQQFFLHDVPNSIYKMAREMGVKISDDLWLLSRHILKPAQEKSSQKVLKLCKRFKLDFVYLS